MSHCGPRMSLSRQTNNCVVRAVSALPPSIGPPDHASTLRNRFCAQHCNPSSRRLVSRSTSYLPTTHREARSMASAMMATQAVAVAGLGSSMLRSRDIKGLRGPLKVARDSSRQVLSPIRAAKLPQGVGSPRDEPKLPVSFWGFTENAEVWNSRASMIGIFGIIIVEAIINKGILQVIGIEVGNGLDLPL